MAQEQKRDQTVRLPNPSAQPFVAALKTARFFAVLFFWVTMVCVLAHVAAFVLIQWTPWLSVDEAEEAAAVQPSEASGSALAPLLGLLESEAVAAEAGELFPNVKASQRSRKRMAAAKANEDKPESPGSATEAATEPPPPAETPAGDTEAPETTSAEPQTSDVRARWYRQLAANILGPARTVTILSAMLLAVTVFLYLQIALLGRLSGIRQLTRSLFLLLIFLVTVVPWGGVFEGIQTSSLFRFERLIEDHAMGVWQTDDALDLTLYYGRYFAYPAVSAFLLMLSGICFASGYSRSVLANE